MVDDTATKRIKLEDGTNVDDGDKKLSFADKELDEKIAKQLNYYFSDVNLINDKFMIEQLEKNDNCVKLSVLATFSRLAQLTKDVGRMIKAVKDFESEYMELDEEKELIRRKKPIPDREEFKKQLELRTLHISGFPDSTLFDALNKFCCQFGEVDSINMRRRFKSRQFKGCIHVVFKKEEDAKKVLDTDVLLFKDRELSVESMEAYHKRKEEMFQKRKERRAAAKS